MATQTENPLTDAATNITVEDNPSETLDTAVPASTKPDRVEDSTTTASSIVESPTEGPKQGADNSKSAAPATDSDKKFRRAERFGINVQLSEKEKRNSRAERFYLGKWGLSLVFFWELKWSFREIELTGVKLEPVNKCFVSGNVCAELDFPFQLTEIVMREPGSGTWRCFIGEWVCLQCTFGSLTGDFVKFGTGSQGSEPESDSVKKSEDLKRKARAERFGIPVPPTATDVEVKKKARVERFAVAPKIDALEENKRKARALRFSQSSSDSLSMNGKGDLEPVRPFMDNFSISFEWDELSFIFVSFHLTELSFVCSSIRRQLLQARLVEGLEKRFPLISLEHVSINHGWIGQVHLKFLCKPDTIRCSDLEHTSKVLLLIVFGLTMNCSAR
ncbi:hypothetical protein DKX38_009756 [Salix brachista]|uniref:THO1-MOS11 C-terminal domain-containing protein n=1 Tax=Salix brachista TaxID=2182728 RepID=A0A5N5MB83_9ROSI|nr:hypothetical protein DKX38_009756 [Salix brachista]